MKCLAPRVPAFVVILLFVFADVCLDSRPPALAGNSSGADLFGAVRSHIEQLVADGEVPSVAVAVAREGQIIWQEGFGFADRENNIPATEHTAYPLASISKPITATGLMVLVERGLVNLDAPINDYLGETKLQACVGDAAGATVRRVASHTAGLPLHGRHFYDGEPHRPPPFTETIRRYGRLVTAPGERWQYSNLGYGILGDVISRLSGRGYAGFMREEVFAPLGMNRTSVHAGPGLEEWQAVKYTSDGRVVAPHDSDSPGAGAVYGSAHDLIRFAMRHLNTRLPDQGAILSEAAIKEMQRPSPGTGAMKHWERQGSGYGIGWHVGVSESGLRVVYHNGGTLGVSTVLGLLPDQDLAVAVLSNTSTQWPDFILVKIVCTLMSCQPAEFLPPPGAKVSAATRPPLSPPPELVGAWRGKVHTYTGKVGLRLEIGASGDIEATLGRNPAAPLQEVSYQDTLPQFLNAGGGPFLRGWLQCELETPDIIRGRPNKLWVELKHRGSVLNGSVITFSQREHYTGPLSHWVELVKE